jgi:V-type H+-transporting ATPase subunit H
VAALSKLEEEVAEVVKEASTFEKYRQEVLSGTLDWTPIHKDVTFWRENVAKFDQQNHQVLRVVVKLMEVSREARTLAVACHDLSMFMQHHAHGKHIVQVRAAAAAAPRVSPPPPRPRPGGGPCVHYGGAGSLLCSLRYVALLPSSISM